MKTRVGEILIQCNGAYAGTTENPSWHVQLIDEADDMHEAKKIGGLQRVRTVGMDTARKEGVSLPDCFPIATAEIMARAEQAEAARLVVTVDLERVVEANGELEKLVSNLRAETVGLTVNLANTDAALTTIRDAHGEALSALGALRDAYDAVIAENTRLKTAAAVDSDTPAG